MAESSLDPVLLLRTLDAWKNGDFSARLPVEWTGVDGKIADTLNEIIAQSERVAKELAEVSRLVGSEGQLCRRVEIPGLEGMWAVKVNAVNSLIDDMTAPIRDTARVMNAVARGVLTEPLDLETRPLKGEFLSNARTINTMLERLNAFASEVTRVAREVGTEGRLGGQAQVPGVAGVWKALTDSVNLMAANLTDQVRGIVKVVTAVAEGDLRQKMLVPARGEVAALADTINAMVDTLATFSDEVLRVAREVGVEGRLGGQATVPGAAGVWKELVDNVNELADNLTTQVRAMSEVATAVTQGDLTRSIQVTAHGEVAALKDNVNQMIHNLRETTQRYAEQDWLKTNLAQLVRLLQGQRDMTVMGRSLLSRLPPLVNAPYGVLYRMQGDDEPRLVLLASYGYQERKNLSKEWRVGEGLVGQCAYEKQRILLTNVPDDYVQIVSGLGQAKPLNIVVLPILFEGEVKAVIELAAFERFQPIHLTLLDQLAEGLGVVINSIEAAGTESQLQQSRALTEALRRQQDELQRANAELKEKAAQLAVQNAEVERKNREIEIARARLQEKAEQLAVTSRYKSEFLANMSHELRTPLNSLLLLAEQLGRNSGGNLSAQQVEMVQVIHSAGQDLLQLINDILDLSKIESGTLHLEVEDVPFAELAAQMERTFRPVTESKQLALTIELDPALPPTLRTDGQRLRQILKNLLANAVKFTDSGEVALRVRPAAPDEAPDYPAPARGGGLIAFAVSDTGIGIAPGKRQLIFEAFQQAEAGATRRYGGTGLGLAISRELAKRLGGEIRVDSEEGVGSTFTLYLPRELPEGLLPPATDRAPRSSAPSRAAVAAALGDDRAALRPDDAVDLLIIENDHNFIRTLLAMAHGRQLKALVATTGAQGLQLARQYRPRAITLDLILPDGDGWTVLDALKQDAATRDIPVHVISVREPPSIDARHGASSYLTKPVDLGLLGQLLANIDHEPSAAAAATAAALTGRTVLLVDDDTRNLFALTSLLEEHGLRVITAENGETALEKLRSEAGIDLVLLDIMMPGMDGFEVARRIRAQPRFKDLPVIALTAKAMKGDRDKCLEAGASDYLAKPVDFPRLLELLRQWLPEKAGEG